MTRISRRFWIRVKLCPKAQYKLAWEAGVNPVVLSQILNGYIRPKKGDWRVVRVGELVGLSADDCWEEGMVP
jgi:hypothetical protein